MTCLGERVKRRCVKQSRSWSRQCHRSHTTERERDGDEDRGVFTCTNDWYARGKISAINYVNKQTTTNRSVVREDFFRNFFFRFNLFGMWFQWFFLANIDSKDRGKRWRRRARHRCNFIRSADRSIRIIGTFDSTRLSAILLVNRVFSFIALSTVTITTDRTGPFLVNISDQNQSEDAEIEWRLFLLSHIVLYKGKSNRRKAISSLRRFVQGMSCPYRHSPAAIASNVTCNAWLRGICLDPSCSLRHSNAPVRPRSSRRISDYIIPVSASNGKQRNFMFLWKYSNWMFASRLYIYACSPSCKSS